MVNDLIRGELERRGHGSGVKLARAAGVTVQTVTKWRKGETTPEPSRWAVIELHLGMEPGTLAAESGYGLVADPGDLVTLWERMEELQARLDRLEGRPSTDPPGP